MRIEWTEPAVEHLSAIHAFIAHDSKTYASDFVGRILRAVESPARFPLRGRFVPEAQDRRIRELLFRSYRIIYRVKTNRVQVLARLHGARAMLRTSPRPWEVT